MTAGRHDDHGWHALRASPRVAPNGQAGPVRGWVACSAGVKVSRSVLRSSAATVSRQTHGRIILAGAGWAVNDVSACWYCASVVVDVWEAGPVRPQDGKAVAAHKRAEGGDLTLRLSAQKK